MSPGVGCMWVRPTSTRNAWSSGTWARSPRAGAGFGYAAVPEEFEQAQNSIEISPKMMARLFDEGYKFSLGGQPWHPTPPGLDSDAPPPRTGTTFTVTDPRPPANPQKPVP